MLVTSDGVRNGLAGMAVLAGSIAAVSSASALQVERRVVDGRFSSGGEVVVDERRRVVLTADRDAVGADGIAPGVSVVGLDAGRWRSTISFAGQPTDLATPAAGAESAVPTAQIPFGIDSDARRGLVVTANSLTDTLTIAPVHATSTSARNRVAVGDHPFGVAIDERAGLAYVAMHGSGRIDVIDVERRRVVRSIGGLAGPTKLALDAATGTLYAGNFDRSGREHCIAVIDTRTGRIRARVPVDPNSRPTLDVATGRVYAASFATGRIAVIDTAASVVEHWIETGSTPHGVAVDPRAGVLYAPNLTSGTVTIIDRSSFAVLQTVQMDGVPLGVAVDERTGWAYVSARDASTLTALRVRR